MKLTSASATAFLLLLVPLAALADVTNGLVLQTNNGLNLDTGSKVVAGSGDLLWTGSSLVPQGRATSVTLGALGISGYNALTQAALNGSKSAATSTAIQSSSLPATEVVAVFTNGGHPAKLYISTNSGGSLSVLFTTYTSAASSGPVVTSVLNNSSQNPDGFPNSGIAPSSLFVIIGTGLADPKDPVLQSSVDPGLPSTLNGASITITTGAVILHPAIYYTSSNQIAAVMPAKAPLGAANLTVTYNGTTSAPFQIHIVSSAVGINRYNGNVGVATDAFTGALISFAKPAKPGEILTLWTTGLGSDPFDSDSILSSSPHRVDVPLHIYVGPIEATVLYAGSAGYPGVNAINLTIPDNAQVGCYVTLAAVVGTLMDDVVTLPISKDGGPCVDASTGLNGDQISGGSGLTIRGGAVGIQHTNTPDKNGNRTVNNVGSGGFAKYSGLYPSSVASLTPGSCILQYPVPQSGSVTLLDAGSVKLSGPNGLNVTLAPTLGGVFAALSSTDIPQSGGTFTFTGLGGRDVGTFTATLSISPLLSWTNPGAAANLDRSQPLHVTWTGGNPGSYIYISGASGTGGARERIFDCVALTDSGEFDVPAYILSAMPAGVGTVQLDNGIFTPFSADGLDIASAGVSVTYSVSSMFGGS